MSFSDVKNDIVVIFGFLFFYIIDLDILFVKFRFMDFMDLKI